MYIDVHTLVSPRHVHDVVSAAPPDRQRHRAYMRSEFPYHPHADRRPFPAQTEHMRVYRRQAAGKGVRSREPSIVCGASARRARSHPAAASSPAITRPAVPFPPRTETRRKMEVRFDLPGPGGKGWEKKSYMLPHLSRFRPHPCTSVRMHRAGRWGNSHSLAAAGKKNRSAGRSRTQRETEGRSAPLLAGFAHYPHAAPSGLMLSAQLRNAVPADGTSRASVSVSVPSGRVST